MSQRARLPYQTIPPNAQAHTRYPPASYSYDKSNTGLEISQTSKQRLGWLALAPALLISALTIGCALGILAWLFSKRKISLAEGFREGYILVDEGVEMEGATLKALSAISLISTLITGASPVLMSLLAYWVSYLWLTEQQLVAERSDNGPTPLQYGLLHQVLSASSVVSLFNAVQYLFRNRSTRPTTPSYFPKAVLLGVLVFTVTQLLGLADLWLHTTTTAVLFNLPSANFDTSPLMTSLSFNQSLCNESDFPPEGGYGVCISSSDGWAQYSPELIQVGQSVVSNSSLDRTVITLADAEDIAIAVPNSISKSVKFTSTSFGMRTRCESLNTRCEQANDTSPSNCNNIGISDIPTAVGVKNNVALYSWYSFTANETAANATQKSWGMGPCCATNPITSLVQLRWSSQISSITPSPNDAVDTYPNPYISIYASCSIEVVNATLRYEGTAEGKEWRLVTEKTIRSEERFASTLIAPYTFQLVTDRLSANIRARAMLATTVDEVMSALNQELSRLALGFVSGGFEFSPALDVQHVTPTILGRYPLVPLLAFVGLLCFYGAIALTFCVLSSKASSASVIISAELRGKSEKKVIMVLELAKTRLSSPLPIVAQLFSSSPDPQTEPRTHNSDALSVKTLGLDLFSEGNAHSIGEVRLRLGLEDGSMRPRYGTWKKD